MLKMSFFAGPKDKDDDHCSKSFTLKKLYDALKNNGDSLAVIEGWSGKSVSYHDLLRQSAKAAAGLRALGVTVGDYVLFCCDKSIVAQYLLLGTMFTGATAVLFPIPHADNVPKMVYGNVIKVVFSDPEYLPTLTKSVAGLKVQPLLIATTDPEDEALQSLLKPVEDVEVFDVGDPTKHIPFILYSSGTTGIPKAIQLPGTYLQNLKRIEKPDFQKFLISSPFFWLSYPFTVMFCSFQNATIVISNSSEAKINLGLIEKYQVEAVFVGSGSMTKYINEPTLPQFDLSSLKSVSVGGESVLSCISRDFFSKVLKDRIPININYGSTELGLLSFFRMEEPSRHLLGVCGRPCKGVEIKITDDSGAVVPIGSLGEVCARTATRTVGYWGRPDLDKDAVDQEGFFKTGDAGFFDQQGVLHLRGRKGDLMTYRGIKVSSLDYEDILMSHPGVLDVAVVGRTHPTDNEHLTAFVVRIPGSEVTEQELLELVNREVSDELRLRGGVHFINTMPRTIIGKIQRNILRDLPLKQITELY